MTRSHQHYLASESQKERKKARKESMQVKSKPGRRNRTDGGVGMLEEKNEK